MTVSRTPLVLTKAGLFSNANEKLASVLATSASQSLCSLIIASIKPGKRIAITLLFPLEVKLRRPTNAYQRFVAEKLFSNRTKAISSRSEFFSMERGMERDLILLKNAIVTWWHLSDGEVVTAAVTNNGRRSEP
mmetsp:Transcript_16259/g.24580  ORF Transcript_16259/g.24580 Transcript_16259/m.24580 type:complete len:134 (+) Transcript_16259:3688-4089(+)